MVGFLGSCEKQKNRVEIPIKRELSEYRKSNNFGETEEERLGILNVKRKPEENPKVEMPFVWEEPEGWTKAPTNQMRMINYRFGENDEGECYVTFLPGGGGGLVANLDRWRKQIGMKPFTKEELLKLPLKPFLSGEAFFIDMSGDFQGMRSKKKENYRMLGLIQQQRELTGFVKLTGPANLVELNYEKFEKFTSSLRFKK